MRETVAAAVAFALLIAVPALAVDDDVLGWQGFRWGISESDALTASEASGLRVERKDTRASYEGGFYSPFESVITLHEAPFTVKFMFLRDTRALGKVHLHSLKLLPKSLIRPGTPPPPRHTLFEPVHAQILQSLTEKYGPPKLVQAEPTGIVEPNAVWTFPTTTITLTGLVRPADRSWPIAIIYMPTAVPSKKDEKQKL